MAVFDSKGIVAAGIAIKLGLVLCMQIVRSHTPALTTNKFDENLFRPSVKMVSIHATLFRCFHLMLN